MAAPCRVRCAKFMVRTAMVDQISKRRTCGRGNCAAVSTVRRSVLVHTVMNRGSCSAALRAWPKSAGSAAAKWRPAAVMAGLPPIRF